MLETLGISVVAVVAVLVLLKTLAIRHVIVYEYQRGLLYKKGRYVATLDPGSYWVSSTFSMVFPVDIRPEFTTIQGQDMICADGVTVKMSLAAAFQVVDPNLAVNKTANFRGNL